MTMAKDAIVSDELAQKFATEKDTPYLRFVRGEGLDVISAHYVPSLRTVELKPWARRGGNAVFINHEASRTSNDCYVLEIPPGKSLAPARHLFEEMIFILDGRGSTTVWNDAGQRVTFEWKAGALFGIPMNCWHQHFNGSGQAGARYVAVTNAPPVINLYEDIEFVFNTKFNFKQRFNGEPDYFAAKAQADGLRLETNFIPDGVNVPVADTSERGAGSRMVRFNLARGNIPGHISQFPVGTYKKAHAHGPGAHVVILNGEGYSLMWPDGDAPRRYEWQPGSLIVPPNMWLHQHFNTGPTPARYLAFKLGSQRNAQGVMTCWISKRLGGDQLDYADESPRVRAMFAEALARHGLSSRMEEAYRKELETLPPLPSREAAE
jgi:oxalate decarboxylase/phosphoglucose isomerase-like protein (cupin superfamily)